MTAPQAKGYYSRLFPPPSRSVGKEDEEKLVRLGDAMRYDIEREGTLTPRVGYTYFSQFVGHDLTHDLTPFDGPYLSPERTANYRTPYLDLDHVYGGGPEESPELYCGEPGTELFKIGVTTPSNYPRDVLIEDDRILIGDVRDLDNLILRQLHVVFLKLHNEAVKQLSPKGPTITGSEVLGTGTIFEQAQRLVRWHYQWIVRHDLLPRILHSSVWRLQDRTTWTPVLANGTFAMPIEFALAAFRFGHSMVRNAYALNCRRTRVTISDVMSLGHRSSPIDDHLIIEWGRFFDGLPSSGPVASSAFIDTSLASPLHDLSPAIIRLANLMECTIEPPRLPVRTLMRGARARLPSGQQVADVLVAKRVIKSEDRLTTAQLTRDTCNQAGTVLKKVGLSQNTPLFFYLLKEAELVSGGLTLGPIGSYVVAAVIEGALKSDPNSYVSVMGAGWKPPLWRFPNGSHEQVTSMIRIIRLVGDNELLPECETRWRSFLPKQLGVAQKFATV